jgi:hypothetical protein
MEGKVVMRRSLLVLLFALLGCATWLGTPKRPAGGGGNPPQPGTVYPTDLVSNIQRARTAVTTLLPRLKVGFSLAQDDDTFAGLWSKPAMIESPMDGSTTLSVKEYVAMMLDPTLKGAYGPIGELNNDLYLFCLLSLHLTTTDATGQPADGYYELIIDESSEAVRESCTGGKDEPGEPEKMGLTVSSTVDTAVYQKKFVIPADGADMVWYTKTAADGTFNLASIEPQPDENGGNAVRSILQLDPVTNTFRYENVSHGFRKDGPGFFTMTRILIDNTTGFATILSTSSRGDAPFSYVVGSMPDATGGLALSLTFQGQRGGDAPGDHNACVAADGTVTAEGALACGGPSIPPISAATVLDAVRTAYDAVEDYTLGETSGLSFSTLDTMMTALPGI